VARKMRNVQMKEPKSHNKKSIWRWSTIETMKNKTTFNITQLNAKPGMVKRDRNNVKIDRNFTILYGLVRLLSIPLSSLSLPKNLSIIPKYLSQCQL
jgi:hypothetical protein